METEHIHPVSTGRGGQGRMLNKEVLYIEYDPDTVDGEGLHTTLD